MPIATICSKITSNWKPNYFTFNILKQWNSPHSASSKTPSPVNMHLKQDFKDFIDKPMDLAAAI